MKKLSILIPVYNAGKYIPKLLDNLLEQTDTDCEIILLDDGSADNSLDVCRAYKEKFADRIVFMSRENKGAVKTRRELLEASSGEWIWIIDSDDDIAKDAISVIRGWIEKADADMYIFDFVKTNSEGDRKSRSFPFEEGRIYEGEAKKEIYRELIATAVLNTLWNKVFRRECVDFSADYSDLYDVRKANDCIQLLPIVTNAEKIEYKSVPLYYYRTDTPDSISRFFKEYTYTSILKVWKRKREFITVWKMEDELLHRYYAQGAIVAAEFLCSYAASKQIENKDFKAFFYRMTEDGVFSEAIKNADTAKIPLKYRYIVKNAKTRSYTAVRMLVALINLIRKIKSMW